MDRVAFYDTKPYDKIWFDRLCGEYGIDIKYIEGRLCEDTAALANGCRAAVIFVNDKLDAKTAKALERNGVGCVALRCAGYNNVDLNGVAGLKLYRVPAYSPAAVAEHAMALLLTLNRKTHKAYNRTKEHNFSLKGLCGFDLNGKTAGVVGTGKVGQAFVRICRGFGMRVIAYDPYPSRIPGVEYMPLYDVCRKADIISLHCPLTSDTHHMLDGRAFSMMRRGVYIINTSRGALIDSEELLDAIKDGKVGGAGLDVYEEEIDFFYEDVSDEVIDDDTLEMLLSQPNVLVTSHQAFLTKEALRAIAEDTLYNLRCFFDGTPSENEIKPGANAKA